MQSLASSSESCPPEPVSEKSSSTANARHPSLHAEKHTDHNGVVRDIIIGFADGLTVPFALTAGLSSSVFPVYMQIYANDGPQNEDLAPRILS